MLSILYPISFFVSLAGLIFWFYFRGNRARTNQMSRIFLGGFFVYLLSLAFSEGELPHKLLVLFRDLVVMGLVSQFFNFFRKNKWLFFGLLAVLYTGFHFYYYGVMVNSFPQGKENEKITVKVDPSAELLMEVNEDHQITELEAIANKHGLIFERAFQLQRTQDTELDDYYTINVPDEKIDELIQIIKDLKGSGLVDYIEDNELIELAPLLRTTPKTGKSKRKYGINDPGLDQLWGFEAMNVDQLYKFIGQQSLKPKEKALIAILDTGVDGKHEDIAGNYKSSQSKYDDDPRGHGTHCAGIAAAVSNNGTGIASFSPDNQFTQVTSIKVLSAYGSGTQRTIINGILEAADKGADVISLSLGGRSNDPKKRAYSKAVKYANDAGAIIVCAAGNNKGNASGIAPANTPGVIAVSAIDENLQKAEFSNHVKNIKMGIAAPGVNIYSTIPGNEYASYNGTSMATPYVSGLIGVMKSINPDLDTKEVYRILEKTGKETKNNKETGKLIQPLKAVEEVL